MTKMRKKPVADRPSDDGWTTVRRVAGSKSWVEHTRRVGLFELDVYEPNDDDPKVTWMVNFEGNGVVMGEFQPSAWAVDAAKREAMVSTSNPII